ncbi:MAG: HEAT repeat domain-containing protein, partial [Bryobacteraceae bacterium]
HVRKAAAEELSALPLKDSTLAALVHKARTDRSPLVRASAIRSIGSLKPEKLLPLLESFLTLDSAQDMVRQAASGVIASIKGGRAQKILLEWSAAGRSENVRTAALSGLRRFAATNSRARARLAEAAEPR